MFLRAGDEALRGARARAGETSSSSATQVQVRPVAEAAESESASAAEIQPEPLNLPVTAKHNSRPSSSHSCELGADARVIQNDLSRHADEVEHEPRRTPSLLEHIIIASSRASVNEYVSKDLVAESATGDKLDKGDFDVEDDANYPSGSALALLTLGLCLAVFVVSARDRLYIDHFLIMFRSLWTIQF